jgi:hypothetical protein
MSRSAQIYPANDTNKRGNDKQKRGGGEMWGGSRSGGGVTYTRAVNARGLGSRGAAPKILLTFSTKNKPIRHTQELREDGCFFFVFVWVYTQATHHHRAICGQEIH